MESRESFTINWGKEWRRAGRPVRRRPAPSHLRVLAPCFHFRVSRLAGVSARAHSMPVTDGAAGLHANSMDYRIWCPDTFDHFWFCLSYKSRFDAAGFHHVERPDDGVHYGANCFGMSVAAGGGLKRRNERAADIIQNHENYLAKNESDEKVRE